MYYSLIGLLAFLLLFITNHDVLFNRKDLKVSPVQKVYRCFLIAVTLYYVTDILWGVFDSLSLTTLLFIDTEIYFIAMAMGVLFWTQYVVAYLENTNVFRMVLSYSGIVFFAGVVVLIIMNVFFPIVFWFDETGAYHEETARNVMLIVQLLLFLVTSVYTFFVTVHNRNAEKKRHITIGLFGFIMVVLIAIQLFEPYLPLYSIGYMLGCSLLRTFVIENEKKEYQRELETALDREKKELHELNTAWELAYTDSMTGAKSKLAYAEKEDKVDKEIYDGTIQELAIVVFDVNGLKQINDSMGHDTGDRFIINACRLICECFKHSPIYRIGGDEFVAVLEGQDYLNRELLMQLFNQRIEENGRNNDVIIAAGMSEYVPEKDDSIRRVFNRADSQMYCRKDDLKKQSE